MKKLVTALLSSALFAAASMAADQVMWVEAKGSCAIVGYTPEHARQLALQHARGSAIEKTEGFHTQSFSVIKDGAMIIDMIRSFASGYIVEEEQDWSASTFIDHDEDPSTPPIMEYGVKINAKVKKVQKKHNYILTTELDKKVYTHGDKAHLRITSAKEVQIALFYYGSDDKVYRIVPNEEMDSVIVKAGSEFVFPSPDADYELVMETLRNYDEVAEAFIIVAVPTSETRIRLNEIFFKNEYKFNEFFRTYAEIAEYARENILPYRVFAQK